MFVFVYIYILEDVCVCILDYLYYNLIEGLNIKYNFFRGKYKIEFKSN